MSKGPHRFRKREIERAWRALNDAGGGGKVRIDPRDGAIEIVPVGSVEVEISTSAEGRAGEWENVQ